MLSKDRGKLWHYAGPPIGFNSSLADNTPPTLWPNSLECYADSETSTFDTTFEPPQMTSNPEDHTDVGISAFEPQMESNHQECADEWTRSFRAFGSGMQPPQMGANLEVYTDEGAGFLPDVGLAIEPHMESNPQAYANEGTRLFLPVGDDIESLQMESDPQAYADEGSSISPISGGGTEPPQTKGNPTNQYSHCPPRVCRYNQDGVECGQDITCSSVPQHFRVVHGIKGMSRKEEIACKWKDCKQVIGRHNFIRHLRTQHMGHRRKRGGGHN